MPLVEFDTRGHVAVITLNRPDARNAINPEVAVRLAAEPGITSRPLLRNFTANGPLAVRAIRRSVKECLGKPEQEALKIESRISAPVFHTEDAREGPKAFMEKRQPRYHGR